MSRFNPAQKSRENMTYFVNCPLYFKMVANMLSVGLAFFPNMEFIVPQTDLRTIKSIRDIIDISELPKRIGGEKVAVNEETGEEDYTYTQGVEYPRLSEFLGELESLMKRRRGDTF